MNLLSLFRARYGIGITIRITLLLLFPFLSYSQSFVGVSSTPPDNSGVSGPTVTVLPPTGMATGDLVVIYAHYRGSVTPTILAAGGQTWITETTDNTLANQALAVFWCRFNGVWAASPSVTVGGVNTNALTATMYVYRPTSSANSWAVHVAAANSSSSTSTNTITGYNTTLPNTVTMAFWCNTTLTATTWGGLSGTGWNKTGLSAQYRNTSGTDQSHTAAYNIQSAAATITSVAQTQGAANATRRTILTWAEVPVAANNLCANAISLNSSTTCVTTPGAVDATSTFTTTANACLTNSDVWYSFVAKSTNPTVSLPSAPTNLRAQVLAGDCVNGFTAVGACPTGTSTATTGLTIGTTYYVRVYAATGGAYTFNICVTDPAPSNDACGGSATVLTSNTSCNYTSGNFYGATVAANPPIAPCTGPVVYDVWYQFVAQDVNATINLNGVGGDITSPGIQLLTNSCTTPVSYGCGTTSIAANNLTVGTTYYIRVYASGGTAPTSPTNAGFQICVTHPNPPPPQNDECTGAITLQNNPSCSNIYGNILNATASSPTITGSCAGTVTYDVWYKFTAATTNPTITLGGGANNFTNRGLQLLSGSCGSLTSIACGATSIAATGLIIGDTYYVRVYSTSGTAPTGNGFFQICVASPGQAMKFGNSYVNITKKTAGGVVEPGDILEIRMTINHTTGTANSMRYVDNIPTNTAIVPGSNISVITNEGIVVPGKSYTQAPSDDAARYNPTPGAGEYNIRMNLGFGASSPGVPVNTTATEATSATGTMVANTDIPKGTTSTMLFATSFRVQVTGNVGDVITLGTGQFIYRTTTGGPDITLTGTPYQILISSPMSLCANSTGLNLSQETGGTFGSGTTLNRTYDLASPMPGYTFVNISSLQGLGDGQYSIVKNMSPRSGTNRNADRVGNCVAVLPSQDACAQRMHGGHWEIDGDHTGTGNSVGNIPTAEGVNSGYMLMVNADYVASEVYRQTITGLCPNTYYEFSAWFRNICATCGNDYTTGNNYTPTRQPGVLPNLTFALDGFDRYNTGEIPYDIGTGSNGWVKKGFVFITGASQTSAVFSIRNNSQGGGGNDWVMDDISVATCLPSMSYSPTLNPQVCQANPITINDTVRSYFSNYGNYKWQRSTNSGSTWTDVPGQTGSVTPTLTSGQWQYITSYQIPAANTTMANNGDMYRLIVATTPANLNGSTCQVTDGVSQISLTVSTCVPVLGTGFISFNARIENAQAVLKWTTNTETENLKFIIERSADGQNYKPVATVNSNNIYTNALNTYSWSEPYSTGKYYYRIKMVGNYNGEKYSRIASLFVATKNIQLISVVNPFINEIWADVTTIEAGTTTLQLIDNNGSIVQTQNFTIQEGLNRLRLGNLQHLPTGLYTLKMTTAEGTTTKKLVKQ